MKIIKRRSIHAYTHTQWKRLGHFLFTKSLHRSEHRTQHHFPKMNCRRRCWQTQFSSTVQFRVTRWSEVEAAAIFCYLYSSVNICFIFGFVVFCLWLVWVNLILITVCSDKLGRLTHWVIPNSSLGSCPLSTNWKNITDQFGKICNFWYRNRSIPDLYRFIWIWFQSNHFRFKEKYANFIHRQGTTDYNCIRHMDQILGEKYHSRLI